MLVWQHLSPAPVQHLISQGVRLIGGLLLALAALSAAADDEAPQAAIDETPMLVEQVAAVLERVLNGAESGAVADGLMRQSTTLRRFYEERGFRPSWIGAHGPTERATAALDALARAADDGLVPERYRGVGVNGVALDSLPERLAELELSLSWALVEFATDLRGGRLDSKVLEPELTVRRPPIGAGELLHGLAAAQDVTRFLAELTPHNLYYRRLRDALARYRAIEAQGGWPSLPPGPNLERGMQGERVAALRRRLEASGELAPQHDGAGDRFDRALDEAVRAFQRRHGLRADGVVGPMTRAALNVPVTERLRQIIVTMERWRWMPDELGERYILVNIAGFELEVVEEGATVLAMPVVVGQPYRSTPVFSKDLTYLVTNPYWNIPRSIAVEDILPRARRDPAYLMERGIRVLHGRGKDTIELNPLYVDWARLTAENFPFRLRQDPGPQNALGEIKFMLPNQHNIYLHDTPERHLFERKVRAASSGCIRLADPTALADYLLDGHPRLGAGGIRAAIESGRTQDFRLQRPVPVHLTYSTVWVEDDGTVHFRDDIYGRDGHLIQALFPTHAAAAE